MSEYASVPTRELTDSEKKNKQVALGSPIVIPEAFKGYLADFASRVATDFYVAQNAVWRESRIVCADNGGMTDPVVNNNTTTWDSLDPAGPFIRHLSDGSYLFFYGFYVETDNVFQSATLRVNGALEADPTQRYARTAYGRANRVARWDLSNKNDNTVELVFRTGTAGVFVSERMLHAVKINTKT